ncbi:MAG: hypothetical protein MSS66_10540 [Selenomonadaceae bacterium]|nr:hypothetical protein [Selenomonadaceae bacterium]
MNNHQILILGWPVSPVQKWLKKYPNVRVERIYREATRKIEKYRKNISFHTPKFIYSRWAKLSPECWYGDWKYDIENYDTVIIIDEVRGRDIFEFIFRKNPTCNVCVFYDSPILPNTPKSPDNYSDLPVRFFSCDPKIVLDYGIEEKPYFYVFQPDECGEKKFYSCDSDVFFVGENKGGRKKVLQNLKNVLSDYGIHCKFVLVSNNRHCFFSRRFTNFVDYMPYDEVIANIKGCKAILELVSDGQTGITQRPYEAIYYGKKLITNNKGVMKYSFYNEERVFVLGQRDIGELVDFINKPVCEYDVGIEYTFERWVRGFLVMSEG